MFKRRKPEEPPPNPPSRGPVIDAGPELPGLSRLDTSGSIASSQPPVALTPPQPKEPTLMSMSRPPFQPTPTSTTPLGGMSPGGMSGGLSRAPLAPARMQPQTGDRRTLVVGRGISVQGTITDAERLVVEGTVEASSLRAQELQIAQGGVLKGQVEVEEAEISGRMDGVLTVKGSLVLRGTGQVSGEARCRRLQVEDGGQLSGKISMITDSSPARRLPAEDSTN